MYTPPVMEQIGTSFLFTCPLSRCTNGDPIPTEAIIVSTMTVIKSPSHSHWQSRLSLHHFGKKAVIAPLSITVIVFLLGLTWGYTSVGRSLLNLDKQDISGIHVRHTSPSYFKVANYSFPSVQQRLKYYMGDWYNKSHWSLPDSDCKLLRKVTDYLNVHGVDIMMHTSQIKECIHKHTHNGVKKYCRDAYDMINSTLDEADSKNNRWVFSFGDRAQGFKKTLPIITKARRSALSIAPQPIVWLLNKRRHFDSVERYHNEIMKQGKEVPWSEKLSKAFWRGSTTFNEPTETSRLDHLAQWINYGDDSIDIAFSDVVQMSTEFNRDYVKSHYFRKKQSLLEMNRYKYLLSVEGNDVASGLKWMLYSNSVVFMSRPTVASWAMEDLLVPFVHYIPLANDYSNLLEMIKWANEHDEACQEISKRATEFIEHLWISEQAQKDTAYLQQALVTSYVNQFDDALSKCVPLDTKDQSLEDTREKLQMVLNGSGADDAESCFRPRSNIARVAKLRPPFINLGMPKMGSTSLHSYFKCGGHESVHWRCGGSYCGDCIEKAIKSDLLPLPHSTCKMNKVASYAQIDRGPKNLVQVNYLNEIVGGIPKATFILTFRDMTNWYKSLTNFNNLRRRFEVANITGLPVGVGRNVSEFSSFYCEYVKRVRKEVAKYPGRHELIEIDIEDPSVGWQMEEAFGVNHTCWGHKNAAKQNFTVPADELLR